MNTESNLSTNNHYRNNGYNNNYSIRTTNINRNGNNNSYIINNANGNKIMNSKKIINLCDKNVSIRKITFSIKYNTVYGEEIGILGSIPQLGNWSEDRVMYLKWSNGIWTGTINYDDYMKDFEYKFVLIENKKVSIWESGNNNKFVLSSLINEIRFKPRGYFNKYEYEYNKNTGELKLRSSWNE